MRRIILTLTVALAVVFIVGLLAQWYGLSLGRRTTTSNNARHQDIDSPNRAGAASSSVKLTKAETMGLLELGRGDHFSLSVYRHANPEAREQLQTFFARHQSNIPMKNAVLALGYIGDEKAAETVATWIEGLTGELTHTREHDEQGALHSSCVSLGLMARRGVKAAERLLSKYSELDFWRKREIRWFPKGAATVQPGEYDALCQVLLGRAIAGDKQLEAAATRIITDAAARGDRIQAQRFEVEDLRTRARELLETENDEVESHLRAFLRGEHKTDTARKELPRSSPLPHPPGQVADSSSSSNEPKHERRLVDIDSPEGREIERAATLAYERFEKAFLDGKFASVADHLMDDLKPLPKNPELLRSDKFTLGCRKVQQLCQALKEAECKRVLAKDGIVTETHKTAEGKLLSETVSVTFVVQDGQTVVAQDLPDMVPGATLNRNGLLILLRRIDGEWYWNPFGW